MSRAGRWTGNVVLVLAVLGTIGCDRVTKHVASTVLADSPGRSYLGDTIWIGYVENKGGFLSLGAALAPGTRTTIFLLATGVMLLGLAAMAIRRWWGGQPALGLVLFVAGGASNWIDRLGDGSVVDFLNVGVGTLRTGVFNVADVAIMVGAIVFVFAERARERDTATGSEPPTPHNS